MSSSHGTLLVIGSGPGIGVNVAKLFAERGFQRVILSSRNSHRLQKEVDEVRAAASGADVVATVIDLGSKDSIPNALREVDSHLAHGPPLEALLFNAARIGPSKLWEFTEEQIEDDFQISVTSLYTVSRWALPKLVETAKDPDARASLLVTSGGLVKDPYPLFFSLAMVKSAQYNFVGSLHKAYAPQGVHAALIVVQGYVKPDAQVATPRNIAEETWRLFTQERGSYDLDVDIVDPEYKERRKQELAAQLEQQK